MENATEVMTACMILLNQLEDVLHEMQSIKVSNNLTVTISWFANQQNQEIYKKISLRNYQQLNQQTNV